MDKTNGLAEVNLHISKDGDFTFSGHISEHELIVLLETWNIQQRKPRRIQIPNGVLFFLGRFSGLFPLVLICCLALGIVNTCSSKPSNYNTGGSSYAQ